MSLDEQPDLDPQLAGAVRHAYVRPIDEITAQRHVSAMMAAAAESATAVPRRRRARAWQAAVAAGLATVLTPAGLAIAGVALPDAIREPYRTVGIELPDQREHNARQLPQAPSAPASGTTTPARPAAQASDPRRRSPADRRDAGAQSVAKSTPNQPKTTLRNGNEKANSGADRPPPSKGGANTGTAATSQAQVARSRQAARRALQAAKRAEQAAKRAQLKRAPAPRSGGSGTTPEPASPAAGSDEPGKSDRRNKQP